MQESECSPTLCPTCPFAELLFFHFRFTRAICINIINEAILLVLMAEPFPSTRLAAKHVAYF